jgi:N-acetylmuramoyl-L-alanine amidase
MIRFVLLWMLMVAQSVAIGATLESFVVQDNAAGAIITCTISGTVKHHVFSLPNPDRVVVDFDHTTSRRTLKHTLNHSTLITRLRSGQPNTGTLRLVFETRQAVVVKTRPWSSANGTLQGLRIELTKKQGLKQTYHPVKTVAFAKTSTRPALSVSAKKEPPRHLRDVVVVLDPGHGGKDPGATGMRHSAEKHVVLAIALKLKQLIDRQPGMRAVLTRNGDYYVGLRERMAIARRNNADIFVAIHADAFNNHNSNGASVFALSPRGATSEAARWLAEKENHSELGGVNLSELDDQNGAVRTVLLDLSQTATIGASVQMGSRVLRGLDSVTTLHNNKVEQARFVVLKSPDIPSILIETGFISNPREEKNLTNPAYQMRMTQAIFQGIKGYFWDYPPHGSRVEAMSGGGIHWVQAGESLPSIASRYHISVARLESANGLSGTRVIPGQKLSIPVSWS